MQTETQPEQAQKQIVNINVKQVYPQAGKKPLSIISNTGVNFSNWDNWKEEILPKPGDIVKAEVEPMPDFYNQKLRKNFKQFKLLRILEVVMRANGPTTASAPRISSKQSASPQGGQGRPQGTLESQKASPVSFPQPLNQIEIDKIVKSAKQYTAQIQNIPAEAVNVNGELFTTILKANFDAQSQSYWLKLHLAEQADKAAKWGSK